MNPLGTKVPASVYAAVGIASASAIGYQLILMRWLAVARWHHFAYLVISTALLGFGTSGTILTLFGRRWVPRYTSVMQLSLIGLAVAAPGSLMLAESLPIDTYQIMLRGSQAAWLIGYQLLLLIPFLSAAVSIGLPLMACPAQTSRLYAVNLVGSGLGAGAAIGLMYVVNTECLPWTVSAAALLAALLFVRGSPWRRTAWLIGTATTGGLALSTTGFAPIDPYKPLAFYQQLVRQGQAKAIARRYSPRGRIDVFESPLAHDTLFASPQAAPPPPQMTLLVDGGTTAPIFRICRADEAAVMDETPLAAVYRTFRPQRVLLMGEIGGANIWLARRFGATHITVVQPNPQIVELLKGPLAEAAGHVLEGADIEVVVAELRGFLNRSVDRFDLIQLTALESLVTGAPGILALNESYVPTVEGFSRCLDRLTPQGVVAVVRGIQEPPRDEIRLMATWVEALEQRGVAEPAQHLLQFRNYLSACTAVSVAPLSPERIGVLQETLTQMAMDPVWYPGMRDDQANRIDVRPGPPASHLSYLDWGARQVLSPRRDAFYNSYAFHVRPATDNCPFFFDFFRWRSLAEYRRSFGRHWLARIEWGYVVLVVALVWSILVSGLLIIVPLFRGVAAPVAQSPGRPATCLYFASLGMGYLLLEMAMIQQFTLILAEPVFAVAVVVTAFLVFSGVGSFLAGRGLRDSKPSIRPVIFVILAGAAAYGGLLRPSLQSVLGWSFPARVFICLLVAGALAVPMGMPFPRGLIRLRSGASDLIPWAWASNGFASVIASVLAVVAAMSWGFGAIVWLSIAAYSVAAIAANDEASCEQSR